ncbi:hypothetical protein HYH03_014720 [Edaphochlamys debaryana]|uniref:Uncharacterized protein n=1 Tax=Edaphochlamys debaryana TaxID=47281 RepID=A0A835XTK7_9CHLO|nr:hypothetical protein HYH03_014720 [Edaphochlamys debaryana]|eukprot:KAG2486665.1 hypothetical protein HYH03_014720 [Edaphochlamys debaryana]
MATPDGPDAPGPSAASAAATLPPRDGASPHPWPAIGPPYTYQATAEDALTEAVPTGLSPMWKMLLLSDGSVTRHLQLLSGSPVSVECLSMRNIGWNLTGTPPGTELIAGPRVQRQVLLRCRPPVQAPGADSGAAAGPSAHDSGPTPAGSASRNDHAHPPGPACSGPASTASSAGTAAASSGPGSAAAPEPETPGPASSGPGSGSASGPGAGPGPGPGVPLVYASSWWNADTVDSYLRDKSKPIWMSLSQGHVELYREVHYLVRGSGSGSGRRTAAEAPPGGDGASSGSDSALGPGGTDASEAAAGPWPGPKEGLEGPDLETLLGCPGPFWGRWYIFWSGGKPLTLIYEVFSPRLAEYLGPPGLGALADG